MKEISVIILEEDPVFGQRLSRYLLLHSRGAFQVRLFTERIGVPELWQQGRAQLLLAAENLMEEDLLPQRPEQHTVVLTEQDRKTNKWSCPSLYRYRSGEEILRLLTETAEPGEDPTASGAEQGGLLGIYSPLGRCGKTAFGLALGLRLAQRSRVLFWSLDCPGSWKALEGRGTEAEELFYEYRQGKPLAEFFSERRLQLRGLEILPCPGNPLLFREVSEEELLAFCGALRKELCFDWIVLDGGSRLFAPEVLLRGCSRAYLPVLEDGPSIDKLALFREQLRARGTDPAEPGLHWRWLKLPRAEPEETGEESVCRLLWGRMGQLAERIGKELYGDATKETEGTGAGEAGSGAGADR